MAAAALALAVLALILALVALGRASRLSGRVDQAELEARRLAANAAETSRVELATLRAHLAETVSGTPPEPAMVLEGRLWRDVSGAEGLALVEAGEVRLLDVRTPQETAQGVIPGALLIPVDELEQRHRELPRAGRLLVYCAGGGRSAAACEFLTAQGRGGLLNLAEGFGAWEGPRGRPGAPD